jgi:hypothetical protein
LKCSGESNWVNHFACTQDRADKNVRFHYEKVGCGVDLCSRALGTWEMNRLKIGHRLQLLNKGISDDVLDTLIRKYTFLRSDVEARFRAYHAKPKGQETDGGP